MGLFKRSPLICLVLSSCLLFAVPIESARLHSHIGAAKKIRRDITVPGDRSTAYPPPWQNIITFPIKVASKEKFQALSFGKRLGILARFSVLHLTFLSCVGPLIMRGTLHAAGISATTLTPWRSLLWSINGIFWHAFHNMLNDWQDLDDDDASLDSYRRAYGLQALQERFIDKRDFAKIMVLVGSIPLAISSYFMAKEKPLFWATMLGIFSMVAYTPLFKPLALGEALIYLVWGPIMAGYGSVAAGGQPVTSWKQLLTDPISALFGLLALGTITGKHTDKINYSTKMTLPKLLGYPGALYACGVVTILPHLVIASCFMSSLFIKTDAQYLPWGSLLAFLTLFNEAPKVFRILSLGPVEDMPTLPIGTTYQGYLAPFVAGQGWPLWFVSATAWHAVTVGYLVVLGCGLEWLIRWIIRLLQIKA